MEKKLLLLFGFVLAFLIGLSQVNAETYPLYNCREIDSPGIWILQTNITETPSTDYCLRITASNVTLDLNNFVIRLTGKTIIILFDGWNLNNITIQNGKLIYDSPTTGVAFYFASGALGEYPYQCIWAIRKYYSNITFKNLIITNYKNGTAGFFGEATALTVSNVLIDNVKIELFDYNLITYSGWFYCSTYDNFILRNSNFLYSNIKDIYVDVTSSNWISCGLQFNETKIINYGYNVSLSKEPCAIPPLPPKYYTWNVSTNCTAPRTTPGGITECVLPTVKIPEDCVNITTVYVRNILNATPVANCGGDTIDVQLRIYNPYPNQTVNETWDTCQYGASLSFDNAPFYNPGDTILALVSGGTSGLCTCWDEWWLEGYLSAMCIRTMKQTTVEIEGVNQTVYCEPNTKWCSTKYTKAWLDYDCNIYYQVCTYGCKDGECLPAPSPEIPVVPVPPEYGWLAPFFSPFFLVTLIALAIAGYITKELKPEKPALVFGIAFIAILIALSIMGIYPSWVAIILIVLVCFILAKFVVGLI